MTKPVSKTIRDGINEAPSVMYREVKPAVMELVEHTIQLRRVRFPIATVRLIKTGILEPL